MSFKQVAVYVSGGLNDYVERCGKEDWLVCAVAPVEGSIPSWTVVIRKERTVHDADPAYPNPYS